MISCSRAAMVPNECHNIGASSGTTSRFLLETRRTKACENLSTENIMCKQTNKPQDCIQDSERRVLVPNLDSGFNTGTQYYSYTSIRHVHVGKIAAITTHCQ